MKTRIDEVKQVLSDNKMLKVAVYVGVGVLSFYLLGKVFRGVASTLRSLNDLKMALNGN